MKVMPRHQIALLMLVLLVGCTSPKPSLYVWCQPDASIADKRKALHLAISTPEGNNHDAFIYLEVLGNKDSVPLLIRALRWQPGPLKNRDGTDAGIMECTVGHCVDALKSLTGEDFKYAADAWQKWWGDTGSKLPPDHFKPRTSQLRPAVDR